MNIMDQVEVPEIGPQIITICGDGGMGKSSLAALFPNPVFIRAEDGVARVEKEYRPFAMPLLRDSNHLWDQFLMLLNDDHDFQTVGFDTISAMDRMFVQDIMKSDPKAKSLNSCLGGYGAGFAALAAMHQRVRKFAEILRQRRGMNTVFIAHAEIGNVAPPDSDDYTRYSLRMTHHKSLPPYLDDVDCVGFLQQQKVVKGDDGERKRVISLETRELICHLTANNVSKNAYGITQPVPFKKGENPLAKHIPAFVGRPTPTPATETTIETQTETETK